METEVNKPSERSPTNLFWRGLAAGITVGSGLFILLKDWDFSQPVTFGIGVLAILIGFILASAPTRSWLAIFGVIIFGFYQIGKAVGVIETDIFRYLVSVPLIILGVYSLFRMMPPKSTKREQ